MTRMIERWFPCKEVSENSTAGWGSGNTERNLFTWFAARPTAQAKAAVICSLLEWPDDDPTEQKRLQQLVLKAMTGRYAAYDEIVAEIRKSNPEGASILDPFSGRGIIPLEAARLGVESHAIDYSPVAVLASHLLTDYPFRDWTGEPELPFGPAGPTSGHLGDETSQQRLLRDVEAVLTEVGRRHAESMQEFYPKVDGKQPWGYLWAVTLPCQECGRRFPLVGSYNLRMTSTKQGRRGEPDTHDPGQSYYIDADSATGTFAVVVHAGLPQHTPTLTNSVRDGRKVPGKSAICPFCGHVHAKEIHQRLVASRPFDDVLLVVADVDERVGKHFRCPSEQEILAADAASEALGRERTFTPLLPAVPHEEIAIGNSDAIRPSAYGAKGFGDLMIDRQTLSFVRFARVIALLARELQSIGLSREYVRALAGFAGANLAKLLKFSTRGAQLYARDGGTSNRVYINHIFVNESSIAFSHDNFETGLAPGPGTWGSMIDGAQGTLTTLRSLLADVRGVPTSVQRASATDLPFQSGSITAVTTDPPYDDMISYADSSDLYFSWLKRALITSRPEFGITQDPTGSQDKAQEIIVKRFRAKTKTQFRDHRTRQFYDSMISRAFAEMRRVVRHDGVVSIVFGHGDPEVWQRLLLAISGAGLTMTGSWPANTESGGQQGAANITTTLTMACRPASANRPTGTKAQVEAEVRGEVKSRLAMWENSGLAPTDMLMASAGPAMEVVGRYSEVLDIMGDPVNPADFLVIARRAVQEHSRIEIDHHPLETFDARTRFALWWVQLFRKDETAKSELRWQTLASDLDLTAVRDLMNEKGKGVRFGDARAFKGQVTPESAVIDVALAMAAAWGEGMGAVGEVLSDSLREDDPYLWATVKFLSERLPDSDEDAIAWTKLVRNKTGIVNAAKSAHDAALNVARKGADAAMQGNLFDLFDASADGSGAADAQR